MVGNELKNPGEICVLSGLSLKNLGEIHDNPKSVRGLWEKTKTREPPVWIRVSWQLLFFNNGFKMVVKIELTIDLNIKHFLQQLFHVVSSPILMVAGLYTFISISHFWRLAFIWLLENHSNKQAKEHSRELTMFLGEASDTRVVLLSV